MKAQTAAMNAMDKQYQAEEDLRTLMHAAEIKADKTRLKAALSQGRKQLKEIEGVVESK